MAISFSIIPRKKCAMVAREFNLSASKNSSDHEEIFDMYP